MATLLLQAPPYIGIWLLGFSSLWIWEWDWRLTPYMQNCSNVQKLGCFSFFGSPFLYKVKLSRRDWEVVGTHLFWFIAKTKSQHRTSGSHFKRTVLFLCNVNINNRLQWRKRNWSADEVLFLTNGWSFSGEVVGRTLVILGYFMFLCWPLFGRRLITLNSIFGSMPLQALHIMNWLITI